MKAEEIAEQIEVLRIEHPQTTRALDRRTLCDAAGVVAAALRVAERRASKWRWIYRAGLKLAIEALEKYQQGCDDQTPEPALF